MTRADTGGPATIRSAVAADTDDLARLLWRHASPAEQEAQSVEAFTADLRRWWAEHVATHLAFVAADPDGAIVGMAWLALVPRAPRPGSLDRHSADIQSVFVLPEHRGRGVGAALITAATDAAAQQGIGRVTVHSGDRALPLYARLGFAPDPHLVQRET